MSSFKFIILFSVFVYTGFFNNFILASEDLLLTEIEKKEIRFFQINQVLAKNHVLPRYQVFANETIKIDSSATKFCLAPDSASLIDLREVFHSAADAWIRVEHINFGPVEENLRLYRINFWPDKHNTGSKHLARILKSKEKTMLEPNKFSLNSVALQGFPALERLLFTQSEELFKGDDLAKFRCNLIKAISRNLREIANSLLVEWVEENSTYINKDSYQNNPNNIELPDRDTKWTTSSDLLSPQKPITLSWTNNQKITFKVKKTTKINAEEANGIKFSYNSDNEIVALYERKKHKIDEIINKVKNQGMEIYDISTDEGDLEDVFIDLTKS